MCLWCKRLLYNIKNKLNRKSSKAFFSPNKKTSYEFKKNLKNVFPNGFLEQNIKLQI